MAVTDNPLKRLLRDFTFEFAHWLLGDQVQSVRPLNISLPSPQDKDISADQLFYVNIKNGPNAILHIEFQGKGTKRPIKWRLLDYMGRLAESNYPKKGELRLCSYVFYIGQGVGSRDNGEYEIKCLDGTISLAWRYGVKHLWNMTASELLALDSPPLLALVGLTNIEEPETVLPEVIAKIGQVEDEQTQGRLLSLMLSLISDEEILQMAEKLIEKELLIDTPYLRRIRQEGLQEGREEGLSKGREEGISIGEVQGMVKMRKQAILDVITSRFDPSVSFYRQVEEKLAEIEALSRLEELFMLSIRGELSEFEAALVNSKQ